MNESTLILRYKQKLSLVGTCLICRMFVIIFFSALRRLTQIGPCFQGPIHGQTLIMVRLGSSWYNCIHWSRFETLSSYKVLLFQTWSLFVQLARKQTVTVILLPTLPPYGGVLLCQVSIKFGGSLLVVRLSLRCDFPQAFGIACVLPSYSFALILSDPAHAALGR